MFFVTFLSSLVVTLGLRGLKDLKWGPPWPCLGTLSSLKSPPTKTRRVPESSRASVCVSGTQIQPLGIISASKVPCFSLSKPLTDLKMGPSRVEHPAPFS